MTKNALQIAVKLLSKKEYSSNKLKISLKKKFFTDEEIDDVILQLQAKNYINDERYCEDRTVALLRKNYGNIYIYSKLETEDLTITETDLNSLRTEYNLEELQALKQTIEDKTKYLTPDEITKDSAKLIRYLVSRGFDLNTVINEIGVDDVSWS